MVIVTVDAVNSWYGGTEDEQDEGVGKLITKAFHAGTVSLIVRFFVGIVIVERYRRFNFPFSIIQRKGEKS